MTPEHTTGALVGLAVWLALRALWRAATRARARSPHTRERIASFIRSREL